MNRFAQIAVASYLMGMTSSLGAAPEQPAETNTAPPAEPEPVIVESRQVRRARERREAKSRRL